MSAILESVLDGERLADCARNDRALANELQAMALTVPSRIGQRRPLTAGEKAQADAFAAWQARRFAAAPIPASEYGMSCVRCGGTPSGESHRGFLGRCTCGGRA